MVWSAKLYVRILNRKNWNKILNTVINDAMINDSPAEQNCWANVG